MRKLILIAFVAMTLGACSSDKHQLDQGTSTQFLPGSTGGYDEIVVVIDSNLWNSAVGDSLYKYVRGSYEVLFAPEPALGIVARCQANQMNEVLRRNRNIIYIGIDGGVTTTDKAVGEMLSQTKDAEKDLVVKRNVWAKPQNLMVLHAKDEASLVRSMRSLSKQLQSYVHKGELPYYKKLFFASGQNSTIRKELNRNHGIDIELPKEFVVAERDDNMMWFRRDYPKSIVNVAVSYYGLTPDYAYPKNQFKALRNDFGHRYVKSGVEGAYMVSDTTLGFISEKVSIHGLSGYVNRGLWSMEGDFKGGPFVNVVLTDKEKSRILMVDMFVYGPEMKRKKLIMRQLESIIPTIKSI